MRRDLSIIYAMLTVICILLSFSTAITPFAYAESRDTNLKIVFSGLVDHSLTLTLAEMKNLPKTTVNISLFCVDFPSFVVAQGNWGGVSLSLLLDQAGVLPEAIKVAFFARDGYSTDLTVETANRADVILAYEIDDLPLSDTPRLVVPGKWGYKWISQISEIVLVDYDFKGKWESLGYSDEADVTAGPSRNSVIPQVPTLGPQFSRPSPSSSPAPTESPPSFSPSITTPSPTLSPSNTYSSPILVSEGVATEYVFFLVVIAAFVAVGLVAFGIRKRVSRTLRMVKPPGS